VGAVIDVLSGFDGLVFPGTLRVLAHHLGLKARSRRWGI
jgi:hypothetical protein